MHFLRRAVGHSQDVYKKFEYPQSHVCALHIDIPRRILGKYYLVQQHLFSRLQNFHSSVYCIQYTIWAKQPIHQRRPRVTARPRRHRPTSRNQQLRLLSMSPFMPEHRFIDSLSTSLPSMILSSVSGANSVLKARTRCGNA